MKSLELDGPSKLIQSLAILSLCCATCAMAQPWDVSVDSRNNCSSDENAPGPTLTLSPGKYDLIPTFGATNVWGGVIEGCDGSGGNCQAGYFYLFYTRVGSGPAIGHPDGCCGFSDRWANPGLAFAHARRSVLYVPGPASAVVKFFFIDAPCSDNFGTMGVQVRPACVADFNSDQVVDFFDYLDFVDAFSAFAAIADINSDGVLDFFDYLDFVDAFSVGCGG